MLALAVAVVLAAAPAPAPVLAGVDVVARADWDPAPVRQSAFRHRTLSAASTIVVHHSDFFEPPGPLGIKDYHLQVSGFSDIGYHFVIAPSGVVYEGRALDRVGAHAGVVFEQRRAPRKDPDTQAIGIVLDGNFDHDAPPLAQLQALVDVVTALRARYGIPAEQVIGHRDVRSVLVEQRGLTAVGPPTVCPGEVLWQILPTVRRLSTPPHIHDRKTVDVANQTTSSLARASK